MTTVSKGKRLLIKLISDYKDSANPFLMLLSNINNMSDAQYNEYFNDELIINPYRLNKYDNNISGIDK